MVRVDNTDTDAILSKVSTVGNLPIGYKALSV